MPRKTLRSKGLARSLISAFEKLQPTLVGCGGTIKKGEYYHCLSFFLTLGRWQIEYDTPCRTNLLCDSCVRKHGLEW